MVISHSDFRAELDNLSNSPGSIPHSVQDGGTLAPTDRIPVARLPASRTPARSRPRTPSPIGIAGAITDAICIPYRLAPETTIRALSRTNAGFIANRLFPGSVPNLLNRFCGASPGFTPPLPSDNYPGGQCACSRYRVDVVIEYTATNGQIFTQPASSEFFGPILDIRIDQVETPDGRFNQPVVVTCRGNAFSGGCEPEIVEETLTNAGLRGVDNPKAYLSNVTVVPLQGQDDSCGNLPPIYRDGRQALPLLPDIDIDIAPNVPVRIQPRVSVDARPAIRVDLGDLGGIDIDMEGIDIRLPPPPDAEPAPAPDNQPPVRPVPDDTGVDPAEPIPDPPIDDPAVEEPTEKSPKVIRAVLVTVQEVDKSSSIITQEDTPDVYVPDLGLVSFRCSASESASGWTPDIRVKNVRCFIPCPYDGGAIEVKGTPRIGVIWRLTPIYDV